MAPGQPGRHRHSERPAAWDLSMTIALLTTGHDVTAWIATARRSRISRNAPPICAASVNPVTADLAQPDLFAHITGSALINFFRPASTHW